MKYTACVDKTCCVNFMYQNKNGGRWNKDASIHLYLCWVERRSVYTDYRWHCICPRSVSVEHCDVPLRPPSSWGNTHSRIQVFQWALHPARTAATPDFLMNRAAATSQFTAQIKHFDDWLINLVRISNICWFQLYVYCLYFGFGFLKTPLLIDEHLYNAS